MKHESLKQTFALQIKAFFITLTVVAVLVLVFLGSIMWSFYEKIYGTDLIKKGVSQAELRSRIEKKTAIALVDSEVIINAHDDGGRSHVLRFEVSFDPQESGKIREMLFRKGYRILKEENLQAYLMFYLPNIPKKISWWWTPARLEKTTMFKIARDDIHSGCFLDEKQGVLFISSYVPSVGED